MDNEYKKAITTGMRFYAKISDYYFRLWSKEAKYTFTCSLKVCRLKKKKKQRSTVRQNVYNAANLLKNIPS